MADGLTIGQAAAFVGVTIKTVRHYHRLGLVAEPERDGSRPAEPERTATMLENSRLHYDEVGKSYLLIDLTKIT